MFYDKKKGFGCQAKSFYQARESMRIGLVGALARVGFWQVSPTRPPQC